MTRLFVFACLCLSTACHRKATACFDYPTVVRVLGCGGKSPGTKSPAPSWCEVITEDGAIVRVPPSQAIVGAQICLTD